MTSVQHRRSLTRQRQKLFSVGLNRGRRSMPRRRTQFSGLILTSNIGLLLESATGLVLHVRIE